MTIQPTMLRPAAPRPAWQVVLGLVLPLPALILLITSYVEPLFWTIRTSFRRFTGIRGLTAQGPGSSVGFDNYRRAFDDGLGGALGYALGLAVAPLLIVLLLAPALAWAAHSSGRVVRWIARGALVVPLAAFSPFGIAVAAVFAGRGERWAYWLGTAGVFAAIAALVYLAAFRTNRSPWPGVIIAGGLAVLGVFAVVLQEFTFAWAGRYQARDSAGTPALLSYEHAFVRADMGTGAAISTVVLVPVLLLGLAATLIAIVTGLRLQVRSDVAETPPPWRAVAAVVAGVLLLIVLGDTIAGLWPWLSRLGVSPAPGTPSTWVNTWIPPLLSTLVGVTAAALAAFGISGLRPLGRRSEWLLLPFGLFLFVGTAPLALRAFAAGATAGRLDTFLALIPPSRLAVPALIVLALLFRGQALRREVLHQENRPAPWSSLVLPALPMLGLAYVATWVVQAQDLIWPLITSSGHHPTAQYAILTILTEYFDVDHAPYGSLLPIPLLILLLLLGVAAQLFYLDRVALQSGLPERDHPPRT
ncbi:hypothetical protein [Dactylosporangium sp. CA-092794]|uniref:hypothetical protein n=1 Tax=Dactylosporangium sp. CA-092794 TaxID=3239929 RepID=UPI003D9470B3